MTENCLLNLVVTPAVEDTVTDWLLVHDTVVGFSTYPISGHGSSERSMSLAEQVAGKRRQILFQLLLSRTQAESLIGEIRRDFLGSGMHYWLVPVLESGHLD
ncbi:MAG: DUF3240 family protein [Candidatus Thiodiazotropha sp. (ex Dulcina madagascariensis)]|nr:DUF3240 family protein [Candidatus Thiodiazotropha sp. (ex Dulcina madagascariensis)]MCU7928818.1 DUF3240 family protein [Candidatus Thiodiazotropha sp. (ex Dulcina madagascariensis)]